MLGSYLFIFSTVWRSPYEFRFLCSSLDESESVLYVRFFVWDFLGIEEHQLHFSFGHNHHWTGVRKDSVVGGKNVVG